jgi:hypothetical protein
MAAASSVPALTATVVVPVADEATVGSAQVDVDAATARTAPGSMDVATSSAVAKPDYKVFRKEFHVPSDWAQNEHFRALLSYAYSTTTVETAFRRISDSFRRLGYLENNAAMVHDYIHYMLKDMLAMHQIPFVDEKGMSAQPVLREFFGVTPDLLIKGKRILEIYAGDNATEALAEKSGKYKGIRGMGFTFTLITPATLGKLKSLELFPDSEVDYLESQFRVFQCEYQYWYSCIRLQKILFNDRQNVAPRSFDLSEEDRQTFAQRQQEWLGTIVDATTSALAFRKNEDA